MNNRDRMIRTASEYGAAKGRHDPASALEYWACFFRADQLVGKRNDGKENARLSH